MVALSTFLSLALTFTLVESCSRIPEGTAADKSPADGRYIIGIGGNPQSYEPGQRYNISIMGIQAIHPQIHTFIGFMLAVEIDKTEVKDLLDMRSYGAFELLDYHETKFSEKCRNVVTHTNTLAKSKIQVVWIAPPPGSGCINFRATVIQHRDVWFMDDGYLTKQFCEEEQDDIDNQPPILEECCACDEAKYELTFEGKWSRHTHPKDFPPDSWSTRFSDIIGASHTVGYTFWKYGEMASEGLREVAEHGSTRALESELKDQSDKIRTIIKARGIAYPNLTGKTFAVFRVDSKHHLISLVSMIHPSPDWIVGVSSLELCLSNCSWVEHKIHNLYPWDAGTDSGPSYNSADQPQIPPDAIRRIKSNYPNDPRSPFYDPAGQPMKPLARLHISRRRLYEKNCEKREGNEDDPVECATYNWSKWSECNAKCGPGKIFRTRDFKNHAAKFKCTTELREERNCIGENCKGNEMIRTPSRGSQDNNRRGGSDSGDGLSLGYNPDMEVPDCALSPWSDFTECSHKCGKGTKTKRRQYLNRSARKKCESIRKELLEINVVCEGRDCGGEIADGEGGNDDDEDNQENKDTDCQYGDWSDWSPCSVDCGVGVESRQRNVWNANNHDRNDLEADSVCGGPVIIEERECIITKCGDEPPPFCYENPVMGSCRDNISSFWYYDYKADSCGLFFTGDCQDNLNKFDSKAACEVMCKKKIVPEQEMTIENLRLEKVDCIVSKWYPRHCNTTCGEGYQVSTRYVLRSPSYGGKPCPKKLVRIDKCFVRCADDFYSESYNKKKLAAVQHHQLTNLAGNDLENDKCRYSEWSNYTPCTPSCGENSLRQKTRTALSGNGKCRDRIRVERCHMPSCPRSECRDSYC